MHGPTCIFWVNLTPFSPQFPSFLGHTVATGEAASGLLRLCSDPELLGPSVPATRNVPVDWQNPGPEFNAIRAAVAEARRRLALVTAAAAGQRPAVAAARAAVGAAIGAHFGSGGDGGLSAGCGSGYVPMEELLRLEQA
jgi:hypothetical protein